MTDERRLDLYTIYERPADLPEAAFAVRQFVVPSEGTAAGKLLGTADHLDGARALVPAHAGVCIPRSPEDEPQIVETWL